MRIAGNRFRMDRLFLEAQHPAVGVDLQHAELAGRRLHAHRQRAHRQVGVGLDVAVDQLGVVHLVDVVAGQDHDVLRAFLLDRVDVLIDGIGRALIPVLVNALLGGNNLDELAQFAAEIRLPAEMDVPVEAHRLVLREDQVPAYPAVEAVRERKIDDPIRPPNGTAGLARSRVSGSNRDPFPPARITANTSFIFRLSWPPSQR